MGDDDGDRKRYHESAYGDLGDGDEDPIDPSELRDGAAGSGPEGNASPGATERDSTADADGEPGTDRRLDGEETRTPKRTGLARTLDRVAETLATAGIYVALAATVIVPFGLAAIAFDVQPTGNYLVSASFAGWTVAMVLALLSGIRESDPYEDAEEKKEIEQGFF